MALVELDLRTRGEQKPVRLVDLAAERGIPEQYLEQLFAGLRRAGVLTGHRGVGGGFTFARRPDRVSVLDGRGGAGRRTRLRAVRAGDVRPARSAPPPAPSGVPPATPIRTCWRTPP